ncbi:unnamed protein product [Merluccius merluccius]
MHRSTPRSNEDNWGRFMPKMECQNITLRSCDLTAETPSLPGVHFKAQVYANGRPFWETYRFHPLADRAPKLQLPSTVFGSSLRLNVTLPLGPGDTPLLEILNQSRHLTFDPVVRYTLIITRPSWAVQVNESLSPHYNLTLKNNNTEYCGYVFYKPNFRRGRQPSQNASFCVEMKNDQSIEVPWFLAAAGLVLVPVILSAVLVYLYAHPRKKLRLPLAMVTGSSSAQPSLLRFPDLNLVFSVPVVCPMEARKLIKLNTFPKHKPKSVSLAPRGYFPQCDDDNDDDGLAREDSSCSSSAGGREVSSRTRSSTTQSSISYADVSVNVPGEVASGPHPLVNKPSVYQNIDMPRDRVIDREPKAVKTSNLGPRTVTSHMASLFTEPGDNPAGALLLPAVRNLKGELTLSMLAFQSQADGDEEEEEVEEMKKPLLVNLEYMAQGPPPLLLSLNSIGGSESDWDSGCDQSTPPIQLSVSSDGSPMLPALPAFPAGLWSSESERDTMASGYKQNWFNTHESTRGYGFRHWPWPQPEVVGEEGEGEEQGDGQLFLRSWVVQIQE